MTSIKVVRWWAIWQARRQLQRKLTSVGCLLQRVSMKTDQSMRIGRVFEMKFNP